jgi:hypothetical protein
MLVHFTGFTRHHIPEDSILHSHRCENLKSYKGLTDFLKFANWLGICLLIGFKKFNGQLSLKVALVSILPSEV